MDNKEFKPFISAEKVVPEFTIRTSCGCVWRGKCVSRITSWFDCFCLYPGSSYLHGSYSCDSQKRVYIRK